MANPETPPEQELSREEIDALVSEGPLVPPPRKLISEVPGGVVHLGTVDSYLHRSISLDGNPRSKDGTVLPCGVRCTARCIDSKSPFCATYLSDRQRKVLLHAPGLMVREAIQQRDLEAAQLRITRQALEDVGTKLGIKDPEPTGRGVPGPWKKMPAAAVALLASSVIEQKDQHAAAMLGQLNKATEQCGFAQKELAATHEELTQAQAQIKNSDEALAGYRTTVAVLNRDITAEIGRAHVLRLWVYGLIVLLGLVALYALTHGRA